MMEAKVVLKLLFDLLVDAKRELQNQSEKGHQARYEEVKESYDMLLADFENAKVEYDRQISIIKMQNEQELSALMVLQRNMVGNNDKNEACGHLQNVIQYQQERLESLEEENKKLLDELMELRSSMNNKKSNKNNEKKGSGKKVVYVDMTEEEEEDDYEETNKYAGWPATPLLKRIHAQRSRLTMNFNETQTLDKSGTVKRSNDGLVHCCCRGPCSTKMCGCVKATQQCGASCRCQHNNCRNRSGSGDDKENLPSSADVSLDATPTSYFDNDARPESTFTKKKKYYFFDPRHNNETNC